MKLKDEANPAADGPLVIVEDYATGASINEATGFATVCAMYCTNLRAVAEALRAKWPTREIIVAADNDQFTDGNPGLTKATEAALAIDARISVPSMHSFLVRPCDNPVLTFCHPSSLSPSPQPS